MFGWIDTKVYDETHDEQKAVGWCGQVLDTNGDGKITKPWNVMKPGSGGEVSILYASDTASGGGGGGASNAANVPFNPKLDTLISYSMYSVIPSPVDDSVWGISELPDADAAGQQSSRVMQNSALQGSGTGLRPARRGYR
jgi:hypothetical protein